MPGFSIGQMFRPTQQVQVATPQPQSPQGQQPGTPPQGTPGSTMQLNNPAAGNPNPPATNEPQDNSPLAPFATLWDTDPNAKPSVDPWSQPILPTDPAKVQAAAKQMNMLNGIDPTMIQKVMAGNDPQALMDIINAVAQNTLAMSAQLTSASVEKAGTTIKTRYDSGLDARFRDFQDRNLSVENPVLNHPGAQPMLQMARQQIRAKNPTMSPQQVQDEAVKYLMSFAGAMNTGDPTKQPVPLDNTGTPEQDWSSF